jgi:hypothetical protein
MRLKLPYDNWAELRAPDEVPRKAARAFRKHLYKMAQVTEGNGETIVLNEVTDEQAAALAIMRSEDGFDKIEDMAEALVLAAVREWSYGAVCEAVLEEVPDKALDLIYDECQRQDFIGHLMPDFGVSPDDESPTTPSGS